MDLWLGLGAHFSSRAVLAAWCGKVIFKARKGQEPLHSHVRGADVPCLLDGRRSAWALNNLWLGLCHKRSQLTVLRGALAKSVCWLFPGS